jgi:SWI/SNF-related matrix-associated actin-dependent regulator 1 of chromatin subfamily A
MATKESYEVVFPFGKHRDKSLGFVLDSDPSYIQWLAGNDKFPGQWSLAAQRLLVGESLADLNLPRSVYSPKAIKVEMWADKDDIRVSFAYDRELLERFKFEIDGRKWDKEDKNWKVPMPQIVKMVELFGGTVNITADDKVKKWYREELARRKSLDIIRVKEDSEIKDELSDKLKLPLFGYQNVGVEFVRRAGGRAMIADSMGLGKTVQAIGYATLLNLKTLIICPKSVTIQWAREIERFTGKKATMWFSNEKAGRIDAQYHVINYDIVERRADELRKAGFDLLVCDEATYLKNRKTKRAKSILGDYRQRRLYPGIKTKHVLFLTGTPVLNRPIEAFVLLNYLDADRFNNFFQFTQKYGGWKGESPRNLDDLHDRTKDLVIRRLKKDILSELPVKQRNDLFVELTNAEVKEYNELLNKLFRKWRSLGKPSVAEMPTIQNYLIDKKIPRVQEMIDEMLEQDRPILIYSCFVDPLLKLHKMYGDKAALIHGQVSTANRQKAIDDLKNGKAKIGLFSIGAGAMGIDGLQHSIDTVIFLDRYWVPSTHEQAEDRLYRTGQTKQVSCFYITCEGTIDEYMATLLAEKQEMIDKVVDGKLLNFNPNKSFFKEFVQKLRSSYSDGLEKVNFDKIIDVSDDELS